MKLAGLLLVLAGFAYSISAQNNTVQAHLYYDTDWNLVDPEFGVYEWISGMDEFNYHLHGPVTVSTVEGRVFIRGQYNKGKKIGYWKLLYGNGTTYAEGDYRNDSKKGIWTYRYPDNSIAQKIEFAGDDFFARSSIDSSGTETIKNGTGNWTWYTYLGNDPIVYHGRFEKRRKTGAWSMVYVDGDTILTEYYRSGNFIEGFVHADGKRIATEASYIDASIFEDRFVQKMENFSFTHKASRRGYPNIKFLPDLPSSRPFGRINTIADVFDTISYNFFWAVLDRTGFVNGKVEVSFIVNDKGEFEAFRITKGLTQEINEIVKKSFYQMPLWDTSSREILLRKPFFLKITIE